MDFRVKLVAVRVGRGRGSTGHAARLGRLAALAAAASIAVLGGAGPGASASCSEVYPGQIPGCPDINTPVDVAFSPNGGLLATANPETYSTFGGTSLYPANELGTVSVFVVGPGGQLGEALGSPHPSGGINPGSVAFSPDGRFLAVANLGGDPAVPGGPPRGQGVAVFAVDSRGVLTPVAGSPFQAGTRPVSVAWSSTGLLAVANEGGDSVSVFSATASGQLQPVSTQPLGADAMPASVSFSPDGRRLVVANSGNDTVSVFSVGMSGGLTEEAGSPVNLRNVGNGGRFGPISVSVTDGGLLAVVGTYYSQSVFMFSIHADGSVLQVTGSPFQVGPTGCGLQANNYQPPCAHPASVSFNLGGGLLATANDGDHTVSVFSVDANGALTPVTTVSNSDGANSLAFSTTGLLAVANDYPGGSVSVFSVGAGGSLTAVTGSPFRLRVPPASFIWERINRPVDVAPGAPGKPAWNLNSNLLALPIFGGLNGVAVVRVAEDGAFTSVPGSIFPVGPQPCGVGGPMCFDPSSVAFSPDGRFLATANPGGNNVSLFTVGPSGALSDEKEVHIGPQPADCVESFTSGGPAEQIRCWRPYAVAFHPDGHYLAVASTQATQTLVPPGTDNCPPTVTVGCFEGTSGARVQMFSVEGGVLTQVSDRKFDCPSIFETYNDIAFNSNGTLLAAGCEEKDGTGAVWVFKVGSDGSLEPGPDSPFPTGKFSTTVAFNPAGNLLAVPSVSGNEVWILSVDEATGTLTKENVQATGEGPYGADFGQAIGPLGDFLATADYDSHTISLFSVTGPSGVRGVAAAAPRRRADPVLTPVSGSPIFTGMQVEPYSITFSPNGHFIATGDTYVFQGLSLWAPTGPLQIRKTTEPGVATQGGVLRYTLTVRNPNVYPVTATVIDDLADVLDKGTYQHDATASIPSVTVDTAMRLLKWHGSLLPGRTVTIRYSVRINRDATGIVTNRVSGPPTSTCLPPAAPELPCETETPIVPPKPPPGPAADLSVRKIASTDSANPGAQVLYTLVVRNHGPSDATGVTVQDPLPAGLFVHSARPSQGSCTLTATDLTCRLGSIRNGGGALVLVEATVADNARGKVANLANVHGDQPDPHPDNNTDRLSVMVKPWPKPPAPPPPGRPKPPPTEPVSNLVVVKRAPKRVTQGRRFRYTVTVTNKGPDSAPNVVVVDKAKRAFEVPSIHTTRGRCRLGPPRTCALGTLRKGARVTVTITVLASTVGVRVNAATAMSRSWDTETRSNLALASTRVVRKPAKPHKPTKPRAPRPPFTG